MRRYLYSDKIAELELIDCDVLIVGSGLAGLYAGLHIDPSKRVLIISKADIMTCSSWLAQGGIASVIDKNDTFESHIADTLKAGAGLCDTKAVEVLVKEGPENIHELIELGVPFDTTPDGELMITREGGHSCRRIVHCGGDATGCEVTKRLGEVVLERKNITVSYNTFLVDIITDDNGAQGAIIINDGAAKLVRSANIILATGGIGALYKNTTNQSSAVGDGIAAAERAGAKITNMEMVQFHPTTMTPQAGQTGRRFLISEAVRGEGGILRNHDGEPFMQGKHELADLAPRDIVTREIIREMRRTGRDNVFLDVSSMSKEFFSNRFPTIYGECVRCGINVPDMWIPVTPSQHYQMGGIETDINGKTNVDGLYACGECAWTGIHGGNRLASNSLLECLVFGRRAARSINDSCRTSTSTEIQNLHLPVEKTLDNIGEKRQKLCDVMTKNANAVRTKAGMNKGKVFVDELMGELESAYLSTCEEYELYSMTQIARMVFNGAIARRKSVGAHFVE